MIYGIGTDIVAIKRLQGMWERHGEKALGRLLAPGELADFAGATDKGRFLAKRFAAKEAFSKALGTGVRPPAVLTAIAVGHDELGKPVFECCGELAEMLEKQKLKAHLSISDEADYAIAYVILEQA
ncbi:4'-phosphopantetheinyl transferase [Dechloromonas denitrificans]|uniref:Holo-[acyl-carrier-protein] synthase n=1 Tax=Dechloromonas denitrificans TaxID=281362 RepID=A0A133XIF9_9RHOO|nr:holo-ACP synthase [Dechloromonas denitrificans]KXB30727.1 4'-phosphopantetheinyl transferase [Dechloromonas denitrificans]